MAEFIVGKTTYRAGKIPVMTQLNIVRRLAPLVAALAPTFENLKGAMDGAGEIDFASVDLGNVLVPLAEGIGKLSDEDSTYLVSMCLSVVERQRAGETGFVRIWNMAANAPQFDDLDLADVLMITAQVIMAQLGSFTASLS